MCRLGNHRSNFHSVGSGSESDSIGERLDWRESRHAVLATITAASSESDSVDESLGMQTWQLLWLLTPLKVVVKSNYLSKVS